MIPRYFLGFLDLLVGLNVGIDLLEKFLVDWYGGDVLCKAVKFYSGVAVYGSTYALVAMSIDRFDSVARPLQTMAKGKKTRHLYTISKGKKTITLQTMTKGKKTLPLQTMAKGKKTRPLHTKAKC